METVKFLNYEIVFSNGAEEIQQQWDALIVSITLANYSASGIAINDMVEISFNPNDKNISKPGVHMRIRLKDDYYHGNREVDKISFYYSGTYFDIKTEFKDSFNQIKYFLQQMNMQII